VPIRLRLALAFALVAAVLVVTGALLFERSFSNGVRSSLRPGLRSQASSFVPTLRSRVTDGKLPVVLDEQDEVAQLLDSRGRVLVTTREAGTRSVVTAAVREDARRAAQFADVEVGGEQEPFRALALPIPTGEIVVVATSLESTEAAITRVHTGLLIGGGVAVLVAAAGGWVLAGAALRPVERMRRTAAAISEHDTSARLPVPSSHDELQALATTMNALLADLQDALRRQRAFVADAGHELRTPLAVLRTELELAGRPSRTRAELQDAVEHAAEETDRLQRLAEDLLFLAHRDGDADIGLEPTPLAPIVWGAVDASRSSANDAAVEIAVQIDERVCAPVAPALLRPAIDNLLTNAIRAAPVGSAVTVSLRRVGDSAVIDVVDEGPGFPPEFLPHAFERFRRADVARTRAGGTGLGLAIVRAVAEAHHGSADAANRPARGAVVTIRVPTKM
jgi:signal transduction histidine kinase